jgi:glycosyltransferase involved in cell wall biosynthesis
VARPDKKSLRILYIHGTVAPPYKDATRNPFFWLSENLEGEVLQRVWWSDPSSIIKRFGEGSYPSHQVGRFRFHWLLTKQGKQGALAWWRMVRFFLRNGRRLHRERPFDCIVTYSHMTTGVCGAILKRLLGIPLIVQVVTSPEHVGFADSNRRRFRDYLQQAWSDFCLHCSLLSADRAHLLAPQLLKHYPRLRQIPASVFHNFVPASKIPDGDPGESSTVLLVGAPWRLKGADLLIKAFLRLSADYPEARLQLVGHYPDMDALQALAGGSEKVTILKAVPNAKALEMISNAAVLVLPSRCEGMGRVLLEAMNAGIPVVGSDVGGIPHIIRHGENGFLFPSEDAEALEAELRKLLADPELRRHMGKVGQARAAQEFTEKRYVEYFTEMVEATVRGVR